MHFYSKVFARLKLITLLCSILFIIKDVKLWIFLCITKVFPTKKKRVFYGIKLLKTVGFNTQPSIRGWQEKRFLFWLKIDF